jgi:Ca2+:H+ antiporter
MVSKIFLISLVFIPVTLGLWAVGASPITIFFLSGLSIIPLAKYIGDATEELAGRTNPAVGGLLNATFGNATEIIIGILGIRAGLPEVVKASITGSIIGNLLLVLGVSMIAGGIRYKEQNFNKTAAKTSATTLLLGAIAFIFPALFRLVAPQQGDMIMEEISVVVSVLMITAYAASLVFALGTHRHLHGEEGVVHLVKWSLRKSIAVLVVATIVVSIMSELLVSSIEPIVAKFGWTELFIGVVFVALIGNAAEHSSAVVMAAKNRMGLSLQIAIGSATQIVMFAAPLLVLLSLFSAQPMTLVFNGLELITIVSSIWITKAVIEDGKSNWYEGVQLLIAYTIMAVVFYFYPSVG